MCSWRQETSTYRNGGEDNEKWESSGWAKEGGVDSSGWQNWKNRNSSDYGDWDSSDWQNWTNWKSSAWSSKNSDNNSDSSWNWQQYANAATANAKEPPTESAIAAKANAKVPPKKEFPHVNALNLEAAKPPPATAKEPAKFPTTAKKPAKSALAKPKPKKVQFACSEEPKTKAPPPLTPPGPEALTVKAPPPPPATPLPATMPGLPKTGPPKTPPPERESQDNTTGLDALTDTTGADALSVLYGVQVAVVAFTPDGHNIFFTAGRVSGNIPLRR